jgi:hypothetical protein
MKKLNSNQLKVISIVFAVLALITILLEIGLEWKNWIEHPKMKWSFLIFLFISIIVSNMAKRKKKEEESSKD